MNNSNLCRVIKIFFWLFTILHIPDFIVSLLGIFSFVYFRNTEAFSMAGWIAILTTSYKAVAAAGMSTLLFYYIYRQRFVGKREDRPWRVFFPAVYTVTLIFEATYFKNFYFSLDISWSYIDILRVGLLLGAVALFINPKKIIKICTAQVPQPPYIQPLADYNHS